MLNNRKILQYFHHHRNGKKQQQSCHQTMVADSKHTYSYLIERLVDREQLFMSVRLSLVLVGLIDFLFWDLI